MKVETYQGDLVDQTSPMELKTAFVMVDPATDQVLCVCSGPTAVGSCPVAERPTICLPGTPAGRHAEGAAISSYIIDHAEPGRCPAA
jgi:hypothetical protein